MSWSERECWAWPSPRCSRRAASPRSKYEKTKEQLSEAEKRDAELEEEYQQLNKAMGTELAGKKQLQIARLQDAIQVVVNSELLFPSGRLGDVGGVEGDD